MIHRPNFTCVFKAKPGAKSRNGSGNETMQRNGREPENINEKIKSCGQFEKLSLYKCSIIQTNMQYIYINVKYFYIFDKFVCINAPISGTIDNTDTNYCKKFFVHHVQIN